MGEEDILESTTDTSYKDLFPAAKAQEEHDAAVAQARQRHAFELPPDLQRAQQVQAQLQETIANGGEPVDHAASEDAPPVEEADPSQQE